MNKMHERVMVNENMSENAAIIGVIKGEFQFRGNISISL